MKQTNKKTFLVTMLESLIESPFGGSFSNIHLFYLSKKNVEVTNRSFYFLFFFFIYLIFHKGSQITYVIALNSDPALKLLTTFSFLLHQVSNFPPRNVQYP